MNTDTNTNKFIVGNVYKFVYIFETDQVLFGNFVPRKFESHTYIFLEMEIENELRLDLIKYKFYDIVKNQKITLSFNDIIMADSIVDVSEEDVEATIKQQVDI